MIKDDILCSGIMKKNRQDNRKTRKEWIKKWFSDGVSYSLFVWIYDEYISWCLHEDTPWKDTIKTETDQAIENYYISGPPVFVYDLFDDRGLSEIDKVIREALIE